MNTIHSFQPDLSVLWLAAPTTVQLDPRFGRRFLSFGDRSTLWPLHTDSFLDDQEKGFLENHQVTDDLAALC